MALVSSRQPLLILLPSSNDITTLIVSTDLSDLLCIRPCPCLVAFAGASLWLMHTMEHSLPGKAPCLTIYCRPLPWIDLATIEHDEIM